MAKVVGDSSVAIAMVYAGRSARACDVCGSKGAHWFCAADDAYLCTACDTQVHCANALALRHERVRLSPTGTVDGSKKQRAAPAQVAPVRKRSRTTRPYSHHLRKLTQVVKADASPAVKAELELFDVLDADEFLVAGNQEVPSLAAVGEAHAASSSSSEFDLLASDYELEHSASADSFAGFFKGKAAHSHLKAADDEDEDDDGDQFLVPDTEPASVVPVDDDAFFFPGDIPGFESLDDFSLSFDLALQNASSGAETFEGDVGAAQPHEFVTGPFAKWFATRVKPELDEPMGPERIKAMLKCCGVDDQSVPSLQLNVRDVLTAWSDRGEPWIDCKARLSSQDSTSSDVGLVPDVDDSQSGGDRDARVLRYKEKRRTRLFSKKIRYEVRKLNAERRPRMKGRFVKRTAAAS